MGLLALLVGVGLGIAEPPVVPEVPASDAGEEAAVQVSFGFLGQLRYETRADAHGVGHGFGLRLARPIVGLELLRGRVTARVMPELAGEPRLLDATATVRVHDALAIQLGQFRPWLSRGFRTGLNVLPLPGRGAVVDRFRVDRDVGITVFGRPADGRLEYYAGVMNGGGAGSLRVDGGPLYTARIVVAPLGAVAYTQEPYVRGPTDLRWAVGASAYTVERRSELDSMGSTGGTRNRQTGASFDLTVSGGPLAANAEGFIRTLEVGARPLEWGAYGQLCAMVIERRLSLAVRSGAFSANGGPNIPLEAGLSVFLARGHAKLQLAHATDIDVHRAGVSSHRTLVQLQLAFSTYAPGRTQAPAMSWSKHPPRLVKGRHSVPSSVAHESGSAAEHSKVQHCSKSQSGTLEPSVHWNPSSQSVDSTHGAAC
ncbi:MAG: hypothetical protein AAF799_43365 [Myxococcota bacterium]